MTAAYVTMKMHHSNYSSLKITIDLPWSTHT